MSTASRLYDFGYLESFQIYSESKCKVV